MSIKQRFIQLSDSAEKLLAAIENKSWDSASHYCQQWDECIRNLFNGLSSDQFVLYKTNIENLELQNQLIQECLTHLRAKTLTQLQEFNDFRNANKHYSDII